MQTSPMNALHPTTLYSYCFRKGDLQLAFWIIACVIKGPTVDNWTVYSKVANYSLLQQTLTRPNSIRDNMETFVFGNNGFYNRHMFIANLGQTWNSHMKLDETFGTDFVIELTNIFMHFLCTLYISDECTWHVLKPELLIHAVCHLGYSVI